MSDERPSDVKFEIGHVLFIDIVGYSKLMITEQSDQLQTLRQIVRATEQFKKAEAEGKLLRLPTGDGGALVFRNTLEAPVLCALEIGKALKSHPELKVRMGIHSGAVNEITDLNEQANIAGAGINMAQRVMDCGDAGHILLSKRVADDLEQYPQWRSHLTELGEYEVKHGARVSVVNLYTDDAGNEARPARPAAAPKTPSPRRLTSFQITVAAVILLIGLGIPALIFTPAILKSLRSTSPASKSATLPTPVADVLEKSIAVLPFENLSSEKENAYFVEGIQDEILTRLAKISALKVISRTSTMRYASRPDNLREIAQQLGVARILEGSVQRAGGSVRINVQLIEAQKDSHLWAESYDREIKNIFSVESEVAQSVADALRAQLLPEETARVANVPTKNSEAHDLFLKAEYFANQIYSANAKDPVETTRRGAALYENAIAADPGFALAYARLSFLKARGYFYNFDPSPEAIAAAKTAADRALTLQPGLGEAHLAMGFVHYWGHRDYERALSEFELARQVLPNNSSVLTAIAFVNRRQGKMDEARRQLEKAAALDPRDNQLPREIASTFVYTRRYAEAVGTFDRALALLPEDYESQVDQIRALQMSGDLNATDKVLAAIPPEADVEGSVSLERWQLALAMRQYDKALAALEHAPAWLLDVFPSTRQPVALLRAQALVLKGETGPAHAAFLEAQKALEGLLGNPRVEADTQAYLALVHAGLGENEAALEAGRRANSKLPVSRDVMKGGWYLAQFAMTEAQVGDKESALNHIQQLLAIPVGHVLSAASLRLDPRWDPIRGDPRFEKLCQEPAQ